MKSIYRLFTGLFTVTLLHAGVHVVDVDDLIELALTHSPDIDSSRFDFEAAKARAKYAEGFYLPRIDLSAEAGEQESKMIEHSTQNVDLFTGTIAASQLLYDFGKTSGIVGRSREETLALKAKMQQTVSDKIFKIKKLYYEILKSRRIIEVQKKSVALQRQQLYRAQRYLKAGIRTIIDVTDAKVRLAQAQLDLKNARYALQTRRAELEEEIGVIPHDGHYRLYTPQLPLPHISDNLPKLQHPLEWYERFAYTHRYLLVSLKRYTESAKFAVESVEGEYYPTLSLEGIYTKQHVDEDVREITPTDQGTLALQMRWNIFGGYQTAAKMEEAKVGVLKAASQTKRIKLAITREVTESYIAIRRAEESIKLSERISISSKKKLEQAQRRYENDLGDYIQLQEAQQGYIQALSNLVNDYYDYFIALAQLDHAAGR
ncbi:TolC family protein [Hydrogenimonas urashimensis]|uniref:TolC family protein n=1 Tax=Hydrogenimonas urashimensis TaxID=2740515 RepID=UPI001915CEE5|nr:TolC family protein [Hydrogenimonas urashimensis]